MLEEPWCWAQGYVSHSFPLLLGPLLASLRSSVLQSLTPTARLWPTTTSHCMCMKAEGIFWWKTRHLWSFDPAHRRHSYLHKHVVDPSHPMGRSNILLPVPLIQERTTFCFTLLLREVLPRLDNGIYYLRRKTHSFHLTCFDSEFCFVVIKITQQTTICLWYSIPFDTSTELEREFLLNDRITLYL